jgi:dihydroxyacetone kinase-like protein
MTETTGGSTLRTAIIAALDAIEASRESLCALDATTGDGDHGVTMAIGARGVRRQLASCDDDPVHLVRAAAIGMTGAGGAIGPIYGRGLLAVAAELGRESDPIAGGAVASTARCLAAAAEAVRALGGAGPGDKTVLDALLPTIDALTAAAASGDDVAAGALAAATAARAGAEATTDMVATVGRSSRFGERSRGVPDPGATSFAIIVEAVATSLGPAPD